MRRTLFIAGVLLGLSFIVSDSGLDGAQPKAGQSPPGDSSDFIEVEKARIEFEETAILASAQSGVVGDVKVGEGDPVRPEDLVASLEDGVPQAQLDIATQEAANQIDIKYARKASKLAHLELEKSKDVNRVAPGAVTAMELEELKLAADRADLQIELANLQAKIKKSTKALREAELAAYRVKAPFGGVVTRVYKRKGEAVRQGDPILELANPKVLRAEAKVPLKDALRLRVGDRIEVYLHVKNVRIPKEQRVLSGTLTFIDVSVNKVDSSVRIHAKVENPNQYLRAGQSVRMLIFPKQRPSK